MEAQREQRTQRPVNGWSRKVYMELPPPSPQDYVSDQERILRELDQELGQVTFSLEALRKLYPLCQEADWKITLLLVWNGSSWVLEDIEAGDHREEHYGLCADLGSTTIAAELVDMNTGKVLGTKSVFNGQIPFGEDILTRIFYAKDDPERTEELRKATIDSLRQVFSLLGKECGILPEDCASLIIAGNTTMVHFLLGLDGFCVFSSPYAVHTLRPDCIRAKDMGLPIKGYVYCYPGLANYLGGDIISGLVHTELYEQEEIGVFLDIGTNGELVVGNKDFLVAGAGAAGPALEGGVVKSGMRAENGAVDRVLIDQGEVQAHVIGEETARGICGSGIVDLLAQMFLNGWMDLRGKLIPESSPKIGKIEDELAVEYAPGLYFWESDIQEFLKTKAAAATMVEYMLQEVGLTLKDIGKFYVAGAFGTHIDKESGVTLGLYPDIPRENIILPGNTSLLGARKMLLHREIKEELQQVLEKMVYIQFGAVDNFLHLMVAAQVIPHIDLERYPSVVEELKKRGRWK